MSAELVTLISSDGKSFRVDSELVKQSTTIKNMLDDIGHEVAQKSGIDLPNVSSEVLQLVLEYLKAPQKEGSLKDGDKLSQSTVFEVIQAANYLDIKWLLDASCLLIASMIKGKSPEDIRKFFNIKNDFTPEEEEQIRKDNAWCNEF